MVDGYEDWRIRNVSYACLTWQALSNYITGNLSISPELVSGILMEDFVSPALLFIIDKTWFYSLYAIFCSFWNEFVSCLFVCWVLAFNCLWYLYSVNKLQFGSFHTDLIVVFYVGVLFFGRGVGGNSLQTTQSRSNNYNVPFMSENVLNWLIFNKHC